MAKQIYVGVGATGPTGVARKVVTPYMGVNGVARRIVAGYVGINGVARPFLEKEASGDVVWEKYNCIILEPYTYEEITPWHGGQYYFTSTTGTFYDDYEFSPDSGYSGIGEAVYDLPDDLSSIVGLYRVSTTSVDQIDSYSSEDDSDWPGDHTISAPYCYTYTEVALCERVDFPGGYEQGDELYGTVTAPEGEYPCDEEYVVEGGASYCVACIGGTYYYYSLQ